MAIREEIIGRHWGRSVAAAVITVSMVTLATLALLNVLGIWF